MATGAGRSRRNEAGAVRTEVRPNLRRGRQRVRRARLRSGRRLSPDRGGEGLGVNPGRLWAEDGAAVFRENFRRTAYAR